MTSAEQYVEQIPMWKERRNSVADVRRFLDELGAPDRGIPAIHVAGTNGKGSVCAYLTQAFRDSGLHTGTFISPHLMNIRERILIDGAPVGKTRFARAAEKVRKEGISFEAHGGVFPAQFEFLYDQAVLCFHEADVDVMILETGLGGRLDATNSCRPVLTVLTSISRDHMQYLGNTIEEIAAEKAGILKPGVPVVYDRNSPEAESVILKKAREVDAAAYAVEPVREEAPQEAAERYAFLPAAYQRENALVAERAWEVLRHLPVFQKGRKLEPLTAFPASVRNTSWTGRMQEIQPDVFLDGGHNEDGARAMAQAGRAICEKRGKTPVLVTAALRDNDLDAIVRNIAEILRPSRVYVTALKNGRSADPEELAERYRADGRGTVFVFPDARTAWSRALSEKADGEILFAAGSLYLLRELLARGQRNGAGAATEENNGKSGGKQDGTGYAAAGQESRGVIMKSGSDTQKWSKA